MDRDEEREEEREVVEQRRERVERLGDDDTGVIGSEAEEPGPGRDTSGTDPDYTGPSEAVAMSEEDPARTRLGAHEVDVEPIGAVPPDLDQNEPDDRR
jgi:hypothetical protein